MIEYSTLAATEKQVEAGGDRFMADLGFDSIHFSQARASNQTPGIPDRKYFNTERGVACWWEAKAERGKQSKEQYRFQQQCEACAEVYLLGTAEVLAEWAMQKFPEKTYFEWADTLRDVLQPKQFRYNPPRGNQK